MHSAAHQKQCRRSNRDSWQEWDVDHARRTLSCCSDNGSHDDCLSIRISHLTNRSASRLRGARAVDSSRVQWDSSKNESIKVAARPLALGTNVARSPRSAKRGTRPLASLEVSWALHQGISESSKAAVFDRARGEMGRMHSKGKGKSRSALPYKRTPPSWLQLTSQEVRVSLSVSVL